jgi:hypothetical protein
MGDPLKLSKIRASLLDRLACATELGRSHHLHGFGDLLSVVNGSDPLSYVAQCCHIE